MAFIFRWLMRLFVGLSVLVLIGMALIYYVASRSIPDYDDNHTVAGISGPIEIVRDTANIPHIFAEGDEDIYFGLGFAHAQDRLWQMTLLRRTAQGRLSELFGSRTVQTDTLIRRLDLYNLAQQSVDDQDPETLAALEAYARGVNSWLAVINEGSLGRGAPEFFMFNAGIAPWTPADSIVIGKIMALQLTGHLQREVLRAQLSLMLPAPRLKDIMPDVPGTGQAALPDFASLVPDTPLPLRTAVATQPAFLNPVKPYELAGASNAWAATPKRSAAGGTLLANDPHLGLTAPTIWYLARLDLSTGAVIGGTFPGVPFVLSGRSDALGWGMTTPYLDDQDLYIEALNPDNPDEYRTPTGFKPFVTRDSVIPVKDADPVTVTLRWTDNGPVLTGDHYDLASITPKDHVTSLSWTALSPNDTSTSGFRKLMIARTIDAAAAAGAEIVAPAQNITLADKDRVGLQMVGAMPRRNPRHQSQGRLPTQGWVAENRWQGVLPYTDNPQFFDPEGGIVGNTNNKLIERAFPRHVSFAWGDTQRIQRWERLMQSRRVHTRDSFMEVQLDPVSVTARSLLPLIAADLWYTGEPAADGTVERQRQIALGLLADWTGEMNEHLPEPLIYAAWTKELLVRLVRDDLGPLADKLTHPDPLFLERVFRNVEGASTWCDVVQSSAVETCVDTARLALDAAILDLTERFGPDVASWRWGDAHIARHNHPVLGEVPLLSWFVNITQATSGGDHTLQRAKTRGGDGPDRFDNVHAAGYRGIYDFADPDSSLFITATGQSGHPLSRHYDDMSERWRRGEYVPMSLDPALARAGSVGVTQLIPDQR